MGLSASMWTGVSGLLAHGEKMNVVGNNIANVNTVGFKASTMHFEDFIYQYANTTAQSNGQIGRGVSVAAVYGDFSQGAFETTNTATDLAIGGNGFFGVSPQGTEQLYYTRAGNFRFDSDGYLVDPHGYVLQGWEIEDETVSTSTATSSTNKSAIRGVGSPTDIQIDGFTTDPQHTTRVSMVTNLNSDETDHTSDPANPFFSLAQAWNGTADPPLGSTLYGYQSSIQVYDEGGTAHDLTIYYDRASNANGDLVWEYIVTMDPGDDQRIFNSGFEPANTSSAGLLMVGTLTFDSAGNLEDMSAFTLNEDATNGKDLSQWRPTAISQNGYPIFAPNFSGLSDASAVIDANGNPLSPLPSNATGKIIEMDFGITNTSTGAWTSSSAASAIGIDPDNLPGFGNYAEISPLATTSYAGSSSTLYMSQDGYTFGYLQNVSVDLYGVISGTYSNGITKELYQVTLYDFLNTTGLRRDGGNLFSETLESGNAYPGAANTNGLGSISSNSLEQSNVDLAREFVNMITTQRGFSANGKVITTTDQMLSEVVQLKR